MFVTYQICSDIKNSINLAVNSENLQAFCNLPMLIQGTVSSGEESVQPSWYAAELLQLGLSNEWVLICPY